MSRYVASTMRHSAVTTVAPDPLAVRLAVSGDRRRLYPSELGWVVELLTKRGLSAVAIAERVGCSSRTVCRWRARLRA